MAEQQSQEKPIEGAKPGFCSAYPVTKASVLDVMRKPDAKTSDYFYTCNLPKRFEHPHWFNGYGQQTNSQHPFYRTTSSDYGWYPPGFHSVPSVYFPAAQDFSNHLSASGMYRNYSLNTGMEY